MNRFLHFVFMFGLWLLLTWNLQTGNAVAGAFIAIGSMLLFGRYFPHPVQNVGNVVRFFWAALYLPYFLAYCVKANLDVAYRVLHRDVPIRPGIVRVMNIGNS